MTFEITKPHTMIVNTTFIQRAHVVLTHACYCTSKQHNIYANGTIVYICLTLTVQHCLLDSYFRTNMHVSDTIHHNSDTQLLNHSKHILLNQTMMYHLLFVLLFLQLSEIKGEKHNDYRYCVILSK